MEAVVSLTFFDVLSYNTLLAFLRKVISRLNFAILAISISANSLMFTLDNELSFFHQFA